MSKLIVVPSSEPTEKQKVIIRVKKLPKPDGMLQCNLCGGRTSLTIKYGVVVKNGRKCGGTIIEKDICASCWKDGIKSQMNRTLDVIKS